MKNRKSPPAKPYIEEAQQLKLKSLPPHFRYEILGNGDTLTVIIASNLNEQQVESLRADLYMILEARVPESEVPSSKPTDDTVLVALFAIYEIPPPPPQKYAKRRRDREEDEARVRKKESSEIEAAKRASIAYVQTT